MINDEQIKFVAEKAQSIRESIIEMLIVAGSGHTAGPLGMADIFALLYFHTLKHDPKNPAWLERDRLVLSNGHICPVQYATMAHAGYFPVEELKTLRRFGSKLQGHPHREYLSSVEVSSGPLGSGLGQAVGMTIADRMDNGITSQRFFYALLSDGEHDCGVMWEAAMLAGKQKLANLIAIIDRNNIQIDGVTEDIMPLEPLRAKWEAFNWHVQEVDGHNLEQLDTAIGEAKSVNGKPSVIIAHTIAGKGIPEIERDYRWHGDPPVKGPTDKIPADKQGEVFLHELRSLRGKIVGEHE